MTCPTCDQLRALYEREKAKNARVVYDMKVILRSIRDIQKGPDLPSAQGCLVVVFGICAKTLSELEAGK